MRHIRTAVCQHPGEPGATNDQPASHGRGPGGTLPGGDVCRATGPLSLILATMRASRSALADVSR